MRAHNGGLKLAKPGGRARPYRRPRNLARSVFIVAHCETSLCFRRNRADPSTLMAFQSEGFGRRLRITNNGFTRPGAQTADRVHEDNAFFRAEPARRVKIGRSECGSWRSYGMCRESPRVLDGR